jgi:hypothetical protein
MPAAGGHAMHMNDTGLDELFETLCTVLANYARNAF